MLNNNYQSSTTNTLTLFHPSQRVQSLKDNTTSLFKITSNEHGFTNMFSELQSESQANVVSTTGDTHAGKSMLIKELQQLMQVNGKSPNVANDEDDDCHAPTTANVNYYRGRLDQSGDDVLFLDVEGSNAGDVLPVDEMQDIVKNFKQYGFKDIPEYMEMRRRSSEEHLSRLSYTLSDVVVFVTGDDFSNNTTKQRAANYIVENATRNVQDILKPSLVIVLNKSTSVYESVSTCTEKFFELHDQEKSLLEYYSTVNVVSIPDLYNSRIIYRLQNGEQKKKKGEELFESQLKVLKNVISQALDHQTALKKENGALLTFKAWMILAENSINKLNSTKSFVLSSMISEALSPSKDEYAIAKKVFDNMIEFAPHSISTFKKALVQSFKMIVAVYFRNLGEQGVSDVLSLDNVLSEARNPQTLKKLEQQAQVLINYAYLCTPCSATFQPDKKNPTKEYPCCYTKCSHDKSEHKFVGVENYYGSNKLASAFRRLVDVKKTTATVKGTFLFPTIDYIALKKEGLNEVLDKIFNYYQTMKPTHSDFLVEIFRLQYSISMECAIFISDLDPLLMENKCWTEEGTCPICLSCSESLISKYCCHQVCNNCIQYEKQCNGSTMSSLVEKIFNPSECFQCVLNRKLVTLVRNIKK